MRPRRKTIARPRRVASAGGAAIVLMAALGIKTDADAGNHFAGPVIGDSRAGYVVYDDTLFEICSP